MFPSRQDWLKDSNKAELEGVISRLAIQVGANSIWTLPFEKDKHVMQLGCVPQSIAGSASAFLHQMKELHLDLSIAEAKAIAGGFLVGHSRWVTSLQFRDDPVCSWHLKCSSF